MSSATQSLRLTFSTEFGQFTILPTPEEPHIFELTLIEPNQSTTPLGKYCSINDAVLAVARQETGHPPWDSLYHEKVPYRVHDLVCWTFEDFFGTNHAQPHS